MSKKKVQDGTRPVSQQLPDDKLTVSDEDPRVEERLERKWLRRWREARSRRR